ncbi:putative ribonuclease H-like domain-containing protein [Tanacetum coccineum]
MSNNSTRLIIEDWDSEDESEVNFTLNKTVRSSIEQVKFDKSTREVVNLGKTWTRVDHDHDNMKYPSTPTLNSAHSKLTSFVKPAHSHVKRPFVRKIAVKNKVWVPTTRTNFPTVGSKVLTAKPTFAAVKGNRGKAVKALAYWIWKPKRNQLDQGSNLNGISGNPQDNIDDKGYWDSGCSRRMTGNISYLFEYEPYNGGYVSFGHGGGKITGKGTIKTCKLEFENVYFVKELKYNLFSVSQICDNKNSVLFTDCECLVLGRDFKLVDDTHVLLRTARQQNMYSIDLKNIVPHKNFTCLIAKASKDESILWHRRLGHLNFKTMNKLVRNNLFKGLPSKSFENNHTCVACLKGKQHKDSCKTKLVNSVTNPLHTLHMDLFRPTSISSLSHKCCDNGGEFRNKEMDEFCSRKGIKREFSNARTPQQNGIAERRNRTLIEAARTMLADAKLPITFWAEAVNTSCYVQNRVLVNKSKNKTPYELFNGRSLAIGFLRLFGCHVMILNTLDHLGKFDAKGDEGYFCGYSMNSNAFRVFNKRTKKIDENLHVDFLENQPIEKGTGPNWLFDIDSLTKSMNYVPVVVAGTSSTNISGTKEDALKENVSSLRYNALPNWFHEAKMGTSNDSTRNRDAFSEKGNPQKEQDRIISNTDVSKSSGNTNPTVVTKDPTAEQVEPVLSSTVETKIPTISTHVPTECLSIPPIIGPVDTPVQTRQKTKNMEEQNFIATIHQKTNPELLQYCLFSCFLSQEEPKKIFDALKDPSWEEGIDYEEVFAPVARIKAIRLFLAYASYMGFTVYQMDVKSAFLYGIIDEEVYVMQPPGFQDSQFPDKVYKVVKAMYGLHQAPKAWYGTFSKYLLDNVFQRGTIDQTLFIRKHKRQFFLIQVYVDDIIFASSNPNLCREFETLMHDKFKISAIRELNFFLGLQVLQKKDGIFLSQDKYVVDILNKFGFSYIRSMIGSLMYLTASRPDIMFVVCACARHQVTPKECHLHAVKRIFRYLKGYLKLGLWYPKESPFDLVAYLDSDYGGATQERKSTIGGCQFLGRRLISWQCKKQTIMATSTTKAEYVAAASGYTQDEHIMKRDTVVNMCINFLHGSESEQRTHEFMYVYLAYASVCVWISTLNIMTKLDFCDYHNMVAILEKTESNTKFHLIVDFLEASHIRVETVDGETKIIAKVNGRKRTVTESSIRRHIKLLDDEEDQTTFQEPIPPETTNQTTSPEPIPQETTLPSQSHPDISTLGRLTREAIRISQSKAPTPRADKTASPTIDDRHGEAFPTATSLDAGQDRENIAKSSAMPHEASARVTSLGGGEGSMQEKLQELMDICTNLQQQHLLMEQRIQNQDLEITQLKNRVKTLKDNEK